MILLLTVATFVVFLVEQINVKFRRATLTRQNLHVRTFPAPCVITDDRLAYLFSTFHRGRLAELLSNRKNASFHQPKRRTPPPNALETSEDTQ